MADHRSAGAGRPAAARAGARGRVRQGSRRQGLSLAPRRRRIGFARGFALASLAQAVGVAASVLWATPLAMLAAALLLGGTFMGMTALGLVGARRLASGDPRRIFALMTDRVVRFRSDPGAELRRVRARSHRQLRHAVDRGRLGARHRGPACDGRAAPAGLTGSAPHGLNPWRSPPRAAPASHSDASPCRPALPRRRGSSCPRRRRAKRLPAPGRIRRGPSLRRT